MYPYLYEHCMGVMFQKPDEGARSPGTGATGTSALLDIGAGNQTRSQQEQQVLVTFELSL